MHYSGFFSFVIAEKRYNGTLFGHFICTLMNEFRVLGVVQSLKLIKMCISCIVCMKFAILALYFLDCSQYLCVDTIFFASNYALTFEFISAYTFLIIYARYYFILESFGNIFFLMDSLLYFLFFLLIHALQYVIVTS